MLKRLRGRTGLRSALVALAALALTMRILVPSGFMPGTSLSQPLMLCPAQGPMPGMAGSHHHGDQQHDPADHPCAFAELAATPMPPDLGVAAPPPVPVNATVIAAIGAVAPGRGLAAPPPPSHAPPRLRA